MLVAPPQLAPGQRELAILVDAETGVAGKIGPDSRGRHRSRPTRATTARRPESRVVVVPNARIIEVGQPRVEGGRGVQEQAADPAQVVPVTFALTPSRRSSSPTRSRTRPRCGSRCCAPARRWTLSGEQRAYSRDPDPEPDAVSQRLLLAIADRDVASSAAALAQEGEGLEVVAVVDEPEEVTRALRRHDVDVVVLHDALGADAGARPRARARAGVPGDRARADRRRLARAAARRDAGGAARRRLAAALARAARGSVRAAAQWSRTLRDRVAGEESAAGALGGRLIAVAGAKGGVGTTTVALQLALAAMRAAPGRPVCVVDFDLQKGDLRAFLDLPHRRSVVDLVEVAAEISVRHLQETLYTHKEGFRVLLAPDEGERGEEIDSGVARAVLNAVKARHALTVVDLGAQVSEASAIGAEIANRVVDRHHARRRLAARRAAPARPLGGGSRCASDEDAPSCSTARRASSRSSPTSRARSSAGRSRRRRSPTTSARSRRRSTPARRCAWRTASCARAFDALAGELGVAARRRGARGEGGERAARPARAARRRARPGERRGDGPAAGADRVRARASGSSG